MIIVLTFTRTEGTKLNVPIGNILAWEQVETRENEPLEYRVYLTAPIGFQLSSFFTYDNPDELIMRTMQSLQTQQRLQTPLTAR